MESDKTKYIVNISKDKHIKYLYVTPFVNGGRKLARSRPNDMRILLSRCEHAEENLFRLINRGIKIEKILFSNASIYTNKTLQYANQNKISVSCHELGWFPHLKTFQFDPLGFGPRSLLSKSRLDNINIDIDHVKKMIDNYKNKYCNDKYTFSISKPYILLIIQYTFDSTIRYGYKKFSGWQDIIDQAYTFRKNNELLIIKLQHLNLENKENFSVPKYGIAVQDSCFNNSLLKNARMVIGVNSTMLYEASLLYDKPVLALGNSWFDSHPEVVQKIGPLDKNIEVNIPQKKDLDYRKKMFFIMNRMQTRLFPKDPEMNVKEIIRKHNHASHIKTIEDWAKTSVYDLVGL